MSLEFDPGSFRDPDARVVVREHDVLRTLSEHALGQWRAISAKPFYAREVASGRLLAASEETSVAIPPPWTGMLRSPRIPVITYPYEWSFGMLKAAALLQLELTLGALDDQVALKDASPFNIQWQDLRPLFIDVTSFEPRPPGALWAGYRQFCEMFLNPLLLASIRGVDFRPWMRGSLEGITSDQLRRLLRAREVVRPAIFKHVYLHARAAASMHSPSRRVQQQIADLGVDTSDLVRRNLTGLITLIQSLEIERPSSNWTSYEQAGPYSAEERAAKEDFVRRIVSTTAARQVLDLGCNTGAFSRIAAETADLVIAVDSDSAVIERLYESLKLEGASRILPLVWDFADPSPGLGWRGSERAPLRNRIRPDLVLALAVVHHLTLGRNLPLDQVIDEIAELGADLLIEFPTPEDPMVQSLLERKRTHSDTYRVDVFERLLARRFELQEHVVTGTRHLYWAKQARS